MNEVEIISKLKSGEYKIDDFYREHRNFFIFILQREMKVSQKFLIDIYTDSVMVFWSKCQDSELDNLKCSSRSYLVGIGRNIILKRFREKKMEVSDDLDNMESPDIDIESVLEDKEVSYKLRELLKVIPEECNKILQMYYYQKFDLGQIAKTMNFPSLNAIRIKKYRCIERLKSLFKNWN